MNCWICRRHENQARFDAKDETGLEMNEIKIVKIKKGVEVPLCQVCEMLIKKVAK